MKTGAELEGHYVRTQRAERIAWGVGIALALVAVITKRMRYHDLAEFFPESISWIDRQQILAVISLGSQLGTACILLVAATLSWRRERLQDAIARAATVERMTGEKPRRVRVLGE